MPTISGVDYGSVGPSADLPWNTAALMPHHERIDTHCGDRLDGVAQALAFVHAAGADTEGHRVGTESLCRRLKAESSAGAVFEEQADNGLAAQGGHLGHGTSVDLSHVVTEVEQSMQSGDTEFVD